MGKNPNMLPVTWTQREPILKATSQMFLGKNPNTLPNTCCLDKARMKLTRMDSQGADPEGKIFRVSE
jgi:hypothetical protein